MWANFQVIEKKLTGELPIILAQTVPMVSILSIRLDRPNFQLLWNRVQKSLDKNNFGEAMKWLEISLHHLLKNQIDEDVQEKLER